MGSRRTDPYCENLHDFSPSDVSKGYPAFVRVNPILDWTFQMVWNFLKSFELPYCSLYEQGYTYLGNKSNTTKN
jgi:FAD synthetase